MLFERRFNVCCSILQADTGVSIALVDSLREEFRDPQQFLLTRFPYADHHRSLSDASTGGSFFGSSLLRGFREVLVHALEQEIDMFSNIFCIVLFDHLLQSGFRVAAIRGYLRGSSGLEKSFDTFEIILKTTLSSTYLCNV